MLPLTVPTEDCDAASSGSQTHSRPPDADDAVSLAQSSSSPHSPRSSRNSCPLSSSSSSAADDADDVSDASPSSRACCHSATTPTPTTPVTTTTTTQTDTDSVCWPRQKSSACRRAARDDCAGACSAGPSSAVVAVSAGHRPGCWATTAAVTTTMMAGHRCRTWDNAADGRWPVQPMAVCASHDGGRPFVGRNGGGDDDGGGVADGVGTVAIAARLIAAACDGLDLIGWAASYDRQAVHWWLSPRWRCARGGPPPAAS